MGEVGFAWVRLSRLSPCLNRIRPEVDLVLSCSRLTVFLPSVGRSARFYIARFREPAGWRLFQRPLRVQHPQSSLDPQVSQLSLRCQVVFFITSYQALMQHKSHQCEQIIPAWCSRLVAGFT